VILPLASILQPLEDAAEWILLRCHDAGLGWGMSIVAMTILVRIAILPLTIKGIKSMNALRALQPQMKEIQEKYKDDKQRQQQEMMKFYRENKINPLGSCLPLLLQIPVFLALFRLLRSDEFASTVAASPPVGWLWIDDLTEPATGPELVILIVLYVGSQLGASMVTMATVTDKTQQRIFMLLPIFFVPIIINFPAGLVVYWITTNFWTLGQQIVVRRIAPPPQAAAAAATAAAGGGTASAAVGPQKRPPPPPRKKKRRRR
jgi:YidC/Oxa1 family membrane protein insertase